MEAMDLFKSVIVMQLFYAFAITGLAYTMPSDSLSYVTSFSDVATNIDLNGTSSQIQTSLEQQTNIPLIELGALVFYSGNILLDLLLNFAFALPQMVALIIQSILLLLNLNSYIWALVQIFSSVVILALYFISLIQLLTNVRSGRLI